MSFLKDAFAIFKKRDLLFLDSYKQSEDVYTFLFQKDGDVTWNPGQYGLFILTHKKVKHGTKPFSIASAPSENVIQITTRIGENPSEYKAAMLEFKKGMKIKMGGPVGSFALQDNSPSLMIAGGIGITPFRSILKQVEADGKKDAKHIHLLYMDSDKTYLFKDELDEIANKTSIQVTYLDSRDQLHQEIDKFADSHKDNAQYLIAGSKSMTDSVAAHLKSHNVSKKNIKKDVFFGY